MADRWHEIDKIENEISAHNKQQHAKIIIIVWTRDVMRSQEKKNRLSGYRKTSKTRNDEAKYSGRAINKEIVIFSLSNHFFFAFC